MKTKLAISFLLLLVLIGNFSCAYHCCPTYSGATSHTQLLKMRSKSLDKMAKKMYKNQRGASDMRIVTVR